MIRRLAASGAALAVLLGAGCGSQDPQDQPSAGDRPTVVASTDVWASVVRSVAGDAVDVETIIDDPAADPHGYEASPSDAADVAGADLLVFNGGGYDSFMDQFRAQSGDKPAVEAYALLDPATGSGDGEGAEGAGHAGDGGHADDAGHAGEPEHADGAEHGAEGGHADHAGPNEHVWYDLAVVGRVADRVAAELGRIDPGQAQRFTDGAHRFQTDLDALAGKEAAIAREHSGAPVAMTEPVAYYLVRASGLRDVTPPDFTEAVEEESDPPAAAVAATRDLLAQRQVRVLLFNPQTETPVIDQMRAAADAAGVPVVEVTETLPPGTGYQDWMSAQIDRLSEALRAPGR